MNDIDPAKIDPATQKDAAGVPVMAMSSPDAIARIIRIVIPIAEMAARLTATPVDDKLVGALKVLLEDPQFPRTVADLLNAFDSAHAAAAAVKSAAAAIGGAA